MRLLRVFFQGVPRTFGQDCRIHTSATRMAEQVNSQYKKMSFPNRRGSRVAGRGF